MLRANSCEIPYAFRVCRQQSLPANNSRNAEGSAPYDRQQTLETRYGGPCASHLYKNRLVPRRNPKCGHGRVMARASAASFGTHFQKFARKSRLEPYGTALGWRYLKTPLTSG